jgi:hypothetical protein
MPEYLEAKKPVHAGVRPTACAVCHSQQSWKPSVFDHPWPLTGAHAKARCAGCHVGQPAVYAGTSKLCVGCHRDDYDRSEYPGHTRFATTCADCHSTTAWKPASKPHDEDATSELASSEAARATRTKPRAASHASKPEAARGAVRPPSARAEQAPDTRNTDVQATDKPSESARPSATSAEPATVTPTAELTHEVHPERRFPIKSGAHEGIGCRTCHDQGGTMGKDDTDCVQCHARAKYDRIHDGVRNYPQGVAPLNFCLRCHASGRRR